MKISPDGIIYLSWGWANLNATIVFTWAVMLLLVTVSFVITRRLSAEIEIPAGQNFLEAVVESMMSHVEDLGLKDVRAYLPFLGTLFVFIAVANILTLVPGYEPPTASLSTTAALALTVFFAVPVYGIRKKGVGGYLKGYLKPSVFMLPFNIISEFSRTLALAVRLFGNIMSGTFLVGMIVAIAPVFFPIIMRLFGVLVGLVQAYIFAVLAAVYISSAVRTFDVGEDTEADNDTEKNTKTESEKGD